MVKSTKGADGYKQFSETLKSGQIGSLYLFHGEERYLLERCLGELRRLICPGGLDGFNYRRFEGKNLQIDEFSDAINTLPSFSERTLIEVHDFDIFKSDRKPDIIKMFSDLPEYVCIVFIFDVVPYKPDGRVKINAELLKNTGVIEFTVQEQDKLVKWIRRHFADAGKAISPGDAQYLAFITGGYMSVLHGEIEKASAYAEGDIVTRHEIDAVVIPQLDAVAYKLTDALIRREHAAAMRILDELFRMREAPHKLLFSISLKMRQLLAARVCIENNLDKRALMDMCGINQEFQARTLMDTARKTTLAECRRAVLLCAGTAYELNSMPEPEARLTELIVKLAYN